MIASKFNCAVLVTNQVSELILDEPYDRLAIPERDMPIGPASEARVAMGFQSGSQVATPALGLSWQTAIHASAVLARSHTGIRTLCLRRAPWHRPCEVTFTISDSGVLSQADEETITQEF